MLLTLLRLLPLLALTDADPAGDDAGAADTTDTDAGREPAQTPTDGREPSKPEPSANKLIKDFVKEHGITVEELLSDYSSIKDANRTEFERLERERDSHKTRAEQLETRYRTAVASSAVKDAASTAGAISPKAVYALIRDDVEFDDDGEPTNIADLIEQAKHDEPQLFRASGGSGDGGRGNNGQKPVDMNDLLRATARSGG